MAAVSYVLKLVFLYKKNWETISFKYFCWKNNIKKNKIRK